MERRQFVKLAGMTSVAATAGLAGCNGGGGGDETTEGGDGDGATSEMAPYNSWLPVDSVTNPDELFAVTLNTQALQELQSSETQQETPGSDLQGDALFSLPTGFLFLGAFATFGFSSVGLGQIAQGEESPTEMIHAAGSGLIAEGSFSPDSLATSVEGSGLSESEEYNGYTIYEGSSGAAALSESAIVVVTQAENTIDLVKAHIDANAGDATLYSEEEQSFADLASALPVRPVMGVVHTTDPEALNQGTESNPGSLTNTDLDGAANGIAGSANFGNSSLTSSAAIRYASESDVNDQATIESALGSAADEQSVSINGTLVVVDGEYSDLPSLQ